MSPPTTSPGSAELKCAKVESAQLVAENDHALMQETDRRQSLNVRKCRVTEDYQGQRLGGSVRYAHANQADNLGRPRAPAVCVSRPMRAWLPRALRVPAEPGTPEEQSVAPGSADPLPALVSHGSTGFMGNGGTILSPKWQMTEFLASGDG
ncbi:hypothetical protein N7462_003053 [Penicillium macrosclerotiorum]|uniref:uncharacterized protein n=1 Tax=Penicillium macrosclerotiorum TaxID=303699 RepID=UPI002548C2EC|nr:uncharacterized protein N7462_003053 [Penicillium macrosclerotiorum]KAJ5688661.1 hypothetical protein N7462_003053 [Penicillium macrosclerotiorum]